MSLSNKILSKILDNTERYFICLRCAECCFRWAITLPNGTKKGEGERCPYLIDIKNSDNQWKEADCGIYNERPEVCKNFKISFATFCPIGLWKWHTLKESKPHIELPERIKAIFKILEELK